MSKDQKGINIENVTNEECLESISAPPYANSLEIRYSILDFVFNVFYTKTPLHAGSSKAPIATFAMSPQYAKVLANLLNSVVQDYETKFGSLNSIDKIELKHDEEKK